MIILEYVLGAIGTFLGEIIFEGIVCGFFGFIGRLFGMNKSPETKAQKRRKRKRLEKQKK